MQRKSSYMKRAALIFIFLQTGRGSSHFSTVTHGVLEDKLVPTQAESSLGWHFSLVSHLETISSL